MTDLSEYRNQVAKIIWETSRADEGTISATGANIIATALLPLLAEAKAEAWDFGYACGLGDYGKGADETCAANPYKVTTTSPMCPDHPDSTMHGIIGDFYCLAPECDWWEPPLEADDAQD